MKAAIMQPYFLPYIGYFQLIAEADVFVVYDNIKYTKKGWINRNRMLLNGTDVTFSLPLKNDSDSLDVVERELAADFNLDRLLNQLKGAYAQAPYFSQTFPLIERIVRYEERNLFRYIHHAIVSVCRHLGVTTEIRVASEIAIDHELKGQDKVIALCEALGADCYVNPIGGLKLYSKEDFRAHGIDLQFIQSKPFEYSQFDHAFVPWLSIVDVMMFNPVQAITAGALREFDLI
jgi:hypothetical protein